jgi:predicted dehydrogenase
MNFHGSKGLIKLTSPFNPQVFGEAKVHIDTKDGMRKTMKFTTENHYVNQLEAFSSAIKRGSEFICNLEFSKGTLNMIDMVFENEKNS